MAGTPASSRGISAETAAADYLAKALADAKGDLLAATAADAFARFAVGANDTLLTADSAQAAGIKWGTPVAKGARVHNSVAFSCPNNAATDVTFDSERFDNDGMHSVATNTERLTCVTPGIYVIAGMVEFAANATGVRIVSIRLNAGATGLASSKDLTASGTDTTRLTVSTIYALGAGDYVTLGVYQNSGAALNVVVTANISPEFAAVRIGAAS